MPSSAAARITRIAISERLATSSDWMRGMGAKASDTRDA